MNMPFFDLIDHLLREWEEDQWEGRIIISLLAKVYFEKTWGHQNIIPSYSCTYVSYSDL